MVGSDVVESARVGIAKALAQVTVRAFMTIGAVGVFLGIISGFLDPTHIDVAEKFAYLTAGWYIGNKAVS